MHKLTSTWAFAESSKCLLPRAIRSALALEYLRDSKHWHSFSSQDSRVKKKGQPTNDSSTQFCPASAEWEKQLATQTIRSLLSDRG